MATIPPPEPRARRTHARRSCDLCKIRKTRCELPDLDVPSSSSPLPPDKSCHRCRVLVLPCVVDDSRMKKRKKKDEPRTGGQAAQTSSLSSNQPGTGSSGPARSAPGTKRTRANSNVHTTARPERPNASPHRTSNPVNHSVDFSQAFGVPQTDMRTSGNGQANESPTGRQKNEALRRTVRLHGRPLSLVSAMLSVASRQNGNPPRRAVVVVDDLDLDKLAGPSLRSRLARGYQQLRTLHPHLQPLDELFDLYRQHRDIATQLLLSASLYVASQSLPTDEDANRLRTHLTPFLQSLQLQLLSHQPMSFHAIQAIEVLALHSPFAPALPFQLVDLRYLAPARGFITLALNISNSLNFNYLVSCGIERWPNPDFWLWCGLCLADAQMSLDDDKPRKPALLSEARSRTGEFLSPDNEHLWATAVTAGDDPAELIGKLTVCDRIARVEELHDAVTRMRRILELTVNNPNFDAVQAVTEEFELYGSRMAAINKRHDEVLAIISLPHEMSASWMAYRGIRHRWELMKEYILGLNICTAVHYLPGTKLALPGLPTGLSTTQAVHYAMNKANDPYDILLAASTQSSAADEMRRISVVRGDLAEQSLTAFIELGRKHLFTSQDVNSDIIPLHDVLALTVECCKALMEIHGCRIAYYRLMNTIPPLTLTSPSWVMSLSTVSSMMRNMGLLCDDDPGGGESVANGCSNLIGSMFRTVTDWISMIEREHSNIAQQQHNSVVPVGHGAPVPTGNTTPQLTNSPSAASSEATMHRGSAGSLVEAPPPGPGMAQPNIINPSSFQRYMPTSDRWMASDDTLEGSMGTGNPPMMPQNSSYPQPTVGQRPSTYTNGHQPTQELDHLLSEVFGYGYPITHNNSQPPEAQANHGSGPPQPPTHVQQHPGQYSPVNQPQQSMHVPQMHLVPPQPAAHPGARPMPHGHPQGHHPHRHMAHPGPTHQNMSSHGHSLPVRHGPPGGPPHPQGHLYH